MSETELEGRGGESGVTSGEKDVQTSVTQQRRQHAIVQLRYDLGSPADGHVAAAGAGGPFLAGVLLLSLNGGGAL